MQEQNLSKDEIQQALDQKGFTKNAIKECQQKQGWNATGELDNQTLSELGVSTNGQNATGQRPSTTGEQHPSNPSEQTADNQMMAGTCGSLCRFQNPEWGSQAFCAGAIRRWRERSVGIRTLPGLSIPAWRFPTATAVGRYASLSSELG
jgi:Putative peptidoglycan binding domain